MASTTRYIRLLSNWNQGRLEAYLYGFDVNRHQLQAEHRTFLSQMIGDITTQWANNSAKGSNNHCSVWLLGTASRTAPQDYNQGLAKRRADEVKEYLNANMGRSVPCVVNEVGLGESIALLEGKHDRVEDPLDRSVLVVAEWYSHIAPKPPVITRPEIRDIVSAAGCLKDAYVKLLYIPPPISTPPKDCTSVVFSKPPEIELDPTNAIGFLCAQPYLEDGGGALLFLQITAFIHWEVEFVNHTGTKVHEIHRVMVSLPMVFNAKGPNALLPGPAKLVNYARLILKAFNKLNELEQVLQAIALLKTRGLCPNDIKKLKDTLKFLEHEFDYQIKRAFPGTRIARLMQPNSGRFAGALLA